MRRTLWALALFLLASGAVAVWAVAIEPARLVVRERVLDLPGWPDDAPPLRVAVLTDLHIGSPFNGPERLPQLVARTAAAKPDLIVLLGDYVVHGVLGGSYVPIETIASGLAALDAPLGVVAVLGNHDWWDDGQHIRRTLAARGMTVLENEALALEHRGQSFWLAGLADATTRTPDVAGTLARTAANEPVIVLCHDPSTFADVPPHAALTLAGHTHGGQVYLPWYGAPVVASNAPRAWAYGHVIEGGRHLLVSGGIGTSMLPVRLNMPPEVVVVTLR